MMCKWVRLAALTAVALSQSGVEVQLGKLIESQDAIAYVVSVWTAPLPNDLATILRDAAINGVASMLVGVLGLFVSRCLGFGGTKKKCSYATQPRVGTMTVRLMEWLEKILFRKGGTQ